MMGAIIRMGLLFFVDVVLMIVMRNIFVLWFFLCFTGSLYPADHLSPASEFSGVAGDFTARDYQSFLQVIREQFVSEGKVSQDQLQSLDSAVDEMHAFVFDRNDLSDVLTQSVSIIWKQEFDPVWQQNVYLVGNYNEVMWKMAGFGDGFWMDYGFCLRETIYRSKVQKFSRRPFNLALLPHIALENSFQHNRRGKCLCVFGLKEGKMFFSVITPSDYSVSEAIAPDGERGAGTKYGKGPSAVCSKVIQEFNRKLQDLSFDVILSSRNQSYSFKEKQLKPDFGDKGAVMTLWIEPREKTGFFSFLKDLMSNPGRKLVNSSL